MSDPTNTTPAEEPKTIVMSASQLVQQAITLIPALSTVQKELEMVVGVYVQVTGKDFVRAEALEDLAAFFETDEQGLRAAILEINRVITSVSAQIVDDFRELTGAELNPKTLDIQGRVQEELDQQKAQEKLARDWLAKVQAIIAKLAVRDLYIEKQQSALKPSKPAAKVGLLTGLQSLAIQKGWLTVETEATDPEVKEHDVDANWLTPPVLSTDNPDYVRLSSKISAVLRVIARYAGEKDAVLTALDNMTMPVDVLESLLEEFSEMIYAELAQVKDITQDVADDTAEVADQISAVRDVKNVYGQVLQAFFPQPTK